MARKTPRRGKLLVQLNFTAYPIQSSLGALGRKWALLVFMNIAFGRADRFNELLRKAPGMGKRILAIRLRELESSGYITRTSPGSGGVKWQITAKGVDVLPVLLTLIHFGSKWRESDEPHVAKQGHAIEITFSR